MSDLVKSSDDNQGLSLPDWEHGISTLSDNEQEVAEQDQPLNSAIFLIDCSDSMSTDHKLEYVKHAAKVLAKELIGQDLCLGVVCFSEDAEAKLYPTTDMAKIPPAIDSIQLHSFTYLDKGINLAAEMLEFTLMERRIYVLTDGMPTDQEAAIRAADKAKAKGIIIIPKGTEDALWDFLNKIASDPKLVTISKPAELEQGIKDMAKLLPPPSKTSR